MLLACAARGAVVTAIEVNAGMLEVARGKPLPPGPGAVEWVELDAAEIEDRFGPAAFDAAVACLSPSEMSPDEVAYTLRIVRTRLVPGGGLVPADEVEPRTGLAERVRAAGFVGVEESRPFGSAFAICTAVAPPEAA